ncbi:MAG: hypothetical protein H0V43_02070 [Gemmatimonadales bacterium]|nr:hypothetical protein [Gemmatimonadales bacterium]
MVDRDIVAMISVAAAAVAALVVAAWDSTAIYFERMLCVEYVHKSLIRGCRNFTLYTY